MPLLAVLHSDFIVRFILVRFVIVTKGQLWELWDSLNIQDCVRLCSTYIRVWVISANLAQNRVRLMYMRSTNIRGYTVDAIYTKYIN